MDSFNPRARMGRDVAFGLPVDSFITFQSTRPHGARPMLGAMRIWGLQVSIHAPAWGATSQTRQGAAYRPGFNPRARMGRDMNSSRPSVRSYRFQSTRPHGARLRRGKLRQRHWSFNPRARMGRDPTGQWICGFDKVVSIHAPAWGATFASPRKGP